MALGLCLMLGTALFAVAGAAAEDDEPVAKPPPYEGDMRFPSIGAPEGPEQFSWEVHLQEGQELVQVDERRAEVRYEDGHRAFTIAAEQAHDANGTEVPTSFEVIAPNVLTLTVHHRAGNPAEGGAPFRYPVIAGQPYTVGYSTVIVSMPEPPAGDQAKNCVAPRLVGRRLPASRNALAKRGCTLGAVRGKRGKGTRVVKQFRAPGTVLEAGARVAVKLG